MNCTKCKLPNTLVKGRKVCKICWCTYRKNTNMFYKAQKEPHNYLECQSCDKLFSKFKTGNRSANRLKTNCPSCKSSDLVNYEI